MWDLDHKEGWALKNWCFQITVLEKTLESPLDCKYIKPVNCKGNQPWIFIGRTDAEAAAAALWPLDVKSQLIGKGPDAGKIEGQRRRGWQKMRCLDSIIDSVAWVWANSGRQWRTGKPGVLQSMGSQRVGLSDCATNRSKLNLWEWKLAQSYLENDSYSFRIIIKKFPVIV